MNTDLQDEIHQLIDQSLLLSDDRKQEAHRVLSRLNEDSLKQLKTFLLSEQETLAKIAKENLSLCPPEQKKPFLNQLNELFQRSSREVRDTSESFEHEAEIAQAEELLDDIT